MGRETEEMEREANEFAMHLLVPTDLLVRDILKMGGIDLADDAAVEKLAKRYNVPVAVMAARIGMILRGANA